MSIVTLLPLCIELEASLYAYIDHINYNMNLSYCHSFASVQYEFGASLFVLTTVVVKNKTNKKLLLTIV